MREMSMRTDVYLPKVIRASRYIIHGTVTSKKNFRKHFSTTSPSLTNAYTSTFFLSIFYKVYEQQWHYTDSELE